MSRIYNDSKHFVDMKLKQSPDETLKSFDSFMEKASNNPSKDEIQKWVEENFDKPGSELEIWKPTDYKENPEVLNKINDKELRNFAKKLNEIWEELGRKMKDEVKENPELYSIIYVENPVIIPGGRFLEFYYWDSYWIIRGLLLSEMTNVSSHYQMTLQKLI
jgi:alpha,alpha-trehalase